MKILVHTYSKRAFWVDVFQFLYVAVEEWDLIRWWKSNLDGNSIRLISVTFQSQTQDSEILNTDHDRWQGSYNSPAIKRTFPAVKMQLITLTSILMSFHISQGIVPYVL